MVRTASVRAQRQRVSERMAARKTHPVAYADGSCIGNPGPGGWGVLILEPDVEVTVRSDSQYVVKTMTLGWKRRENVELWQQLDAEVAQRKVNFEWVRGHAGDPHNERADELANRAATQAAKAGRDVFSRGASTESSSKAARVVHNDESEAEVTRQLRPLLEGGETIARCEGCGRMFIACSVPVMMPYCTLASCQLKARHRNKM